MRRRDQQLRLRQSAWSVEVLARDVQELKRDVSRLRGLVETATGLARFGVEPSVDLVVAAELLHMRPETLRRYLSTHKAEFPARYRLDGPEHRRVRILYASELQRLRQKRWRGSV